MTCEFHCEHCRVIYYLRYTPLKSTDDIDEDDMDEDDVGAGGSRGGIGGPRMKKSRYIDPKDMTEEQRLERR